MTQYLLISEAPSMAELLACCLDDLDVAASILFGLEVAPLSVSAINGPRTLEEIRGAA